MKLCHVLALLVRVTGGLKEERGDKEAVEGKRENKDIVVPMQLDVWQNKSTPLTEKELQLLGRGEQIPTLCFKKKKTHNSFT